MNSSFKSEELKFPIQGSAEIRNQDEARNRGELNKRLDQHTTREPQKSTEGQLRISLTISDDQSVVEKVEERNLLALKNRTTSTYPSGSGNRTGTHIWQDFQRQLALLRERNKIRLLMARQEQDKQTFLMAQQEQEFTSGGAGIELVAPSNNPVLAESSTTPISLTMGKRPIIESLPEDSDSLSDDVSDMDLVELRSYVKRLRAKTVAKRTGKTRVYDLGYQVLYRILNEEGSSGGKLKKVLSPPYFDPPKIIKGPRDVQILRCVAPVDNFDLFLEQNKHLSFIVYRTFIAPSNHGTKTSAGSDDQDTPPQINESIRPISPHLIDVLETILKSQEEYAEILQTLNSISELNAPYLFMYHHRHALETIREGANVLSRENLSLFSNYMTQSCGQQYAAANALISLGRILPEYVIYLFKPGDILVRHHGGEYDGWITRSWPQEMHRERLPRAVAESKRKTGLLPLNGLKETAGNMGNDIVKLQHWGVDAWQWSFDGNFQRQMSLLHFCI